MIKATIVASKAITNTGTLDILDIIHNIDDRVVVQGPDGKVHNLKLNANAKGIYFSLYGVRHYTNDFIKV